MARLGRVVKCWKEKSAKFLQLLLVLQKETARQFIFRGLKEC